MENVLNVAQYIYGEYKRETCEKIDELKLQKLIYFCQRESFAIKGVQLFNDSLEGWVHGPVSPIVRMYYEEDFGINYSTNELIEDDARIVRNVLAEYGGLASWKLRNLSHEEISWRNSRMGLNPNDRGNRKLNLDDIKKDAEKVRPFDYTWGMYYDEFDDYEEGASWVM